MKTGAVIAAAGHRTAGSAFRPMLPVGDSTVIRRIIISLKQAGVSPIVVVTGERGDELEKHIAKLGVICLRNEDNKTPQMFVSVCMGLRYISELCDRMFILPAKYPAFLPDTVERMMQEQADLVWPVYDGKRGHPVLVATEVVNDILSYQGENGLRGAFRQLTGCKICEVEVEDQGIIRAVETDEDTENVFFSGQKIPLHQEIQIWLSRDEKCFDSELARFLSLIDHTGSMQTACRQMHMSYTKGWKLLKEAERQLGFSLLMTQSGGSDGGSSQLTPKSRDFLERYLKMEEGLKQEGERLYRLYFPEEEGQEHETIV